MTFTFVPRRNQAKFKPKFSENKIREAVVCALRLKIEKPRTYLIQGKFCQRFNILN